MPTKGGVNMSLKLYDQLKEAAAVVNKTADYEKSIKEISSKIFIVNFIPL